MAITIIQEPNNNEFSNHPHALLLNSDNKSTSGFRYLVEVFSGTSQNQSLGRFLLPKQNDTGYGFIDLNRVIRPYLNPTFTQGAFGWNFAGQGQHFYKYNFQVGEAVSALPFNSINNGGTGGIAQLSASTSFSNIEAGDQLVVVQESDAPFNVYNGLHTVLGVGEVVRKINIDVAYQATDSLFSGYCYLYNGEPIITEFLASGTVGTILSAPNYVESVTATTDVTFSIGAGDEGRLFSRSPLEISMAEGKDAFLQVENTKGNASVDLAHVVTFDANGAELGGYSIPIDFSTTINDLDRQVLQLGIGTANLANLPSSAYTVNWGQSTLWDGVDSYTYQIVNSGGTTYSSSTYTVNVDCPFIGYDHLSLFFLDTLGSWWSFPMKMESIESTDIERNTFRRPFGTLVDSFSWGTSDRGNKVFSQRARRQLELSTAPLSDDESDFFHELLMSPEVYRYDTNGNLIAVVVDEGSFVKKKIINDLVEYRIRVTDAIDLNTI